MIRRSIATETRASGRRFVGGGGTSVRCLVAKPTAESESNGSMPDTS